MGGETDFLLLMRRVGDGDEDARRLLAERYPDWLALRDQGFLGAKSDGKLPLGWRAGFYTFEQLERLGIPPAGLTKARERYREWREALLPMPQASGVIWPVTTKYRCLVVSGPPSFRSDRSDFPEKLLPNVRGEAGSELLFARLWQHGYRFPCLTLRRTASGVGITADGLERVRSRREALELAKHLPSLLSLKKWGRPLANEDPEVRRIVREANRMRAKQPRPKWSAIADQLGVPERKLRRWRAAP